MDGMVCHSIWTPRSQKKIEQLIRIKKIDIDRDWAMVHKAC